MIPWEIPPEGRTGVGPSIKSSFIFESFEFSNSVHFNVNFGSGKFLYFGFIFVQISSFLVINLIIKEFINI